MQRLWVFLGVLFWSVWNSYALSSTQNIREDLERLQLYLQEYVLGAEQCIPNQRELDFKECVGNFHSTTVLGRQLEAKNYKKYAKKYKEILKSELLSLRYEAPKQKPKKNVSKNFYGTYIFTDPARTKYSDLLNRNLPTSFTELKNKMNALFPLVKITTQRKVFYNNARYHLYKDLLEECSPKDFPWVKGKKAICKAMLSFARSEKIWMIEKDKYTGFQHIQGQSQPRKWPWNFIKINQGLKILSSSIGQLKFEDLVHYFMMTFEYWDAVNLDVLCFFEDLATLKLGTTEKNAWRFFRDELIDFDPEYKSLPVSNERKFFQGLSVLWHSLYGEDNEKEFIKNVKKGNLWLKVTKGLHSERGLIHYLYKRFLRSPSSPDKIWNFVNKIEEFKENKKGTLINTFRDTLYTGAAPTYYAQIPKRFLTQDTRQTNLTHSNGKTYPRVKSFWPVGLELTKILLVCKETLTASLHSTQSGLNTIRVCTLRNQNKLWNGAYPVITCFPVYDQRPLGSSNANCKNVVVP